MAIKQAFRQGTRIAMVLASSAATPALAAGPGFDITFEGAVDGSFSDKTRAEVAPEHEFRHFYEGSNAEGPYELEFNARMAPMTVFGEAGGASVHFRIRQPLGAGEYEIGDNETEETPVFVTVYAYQEEGDLDESKLWFTGSADGNFAVETMSTDEITGDFSFTIQNGGGTDSLTANGNFSAIPYEISPDIRIRQTGVFEFPDDPPHFNENSATIEGDQLIITLSQKWGFTLVFTLPASTSTGETLKVGKNEAVSGIAKIRGQDIPALKGTFTLKRKGDYIGAAFEVSSSLKGKAGGFDGEIGYVPIR